MRFFLNFKKQFSFVMLIALVFSFFGANAQIQSYSDSWGSSGISLKSESKFSVTLNFSITEFQLIDMTTDKIRLSPSLFIPMITMLKRKSARINCINNHLSSTTCPTA
jgi:hypothetical protein